MNFAPYQDESPDTSRALSPPPLHSPRRSLDHSPRPGHSRNISAIAAQKAPATDPWSAQRLPSPDAFEPSRIQGHGGGLREVESGRGLDMFETSLPLRMDWEACLAYLLLPPAGGVILLIVERKSDYVRFHAWQSSMLFSLLFIVHLIFSWTKVISYMLLAVDLLLIGYLTFRAYKDADTLDRFEIPYIGPLASRFLDDE